MLLRSLLCLPLLATLAVAQDRQVVYTAPGVLAEAYGLDLVATRALTSRLEVTGGGAGVFLYSLLPDPTPRCHQTLLIGSGETRTPLAALGINGWLLVDPTFVALTVPLRDPIWLPYGPQLAGLEIWMQSVLVLPVDGWGYFYSFSNGIRLRYFST